MLARHVPEDVIEKYFMGHLPASDLEWVEEHLLACSECQDRAVEVEEFIHVTKAALRLEQRKPVATAQQLRSSPSWRESLSTFPTAFQMWVYAPAAAALAVAMLTVALPALRHTPASAGLASQGSASEIEMNSMRGADVISHAHSNSPLTLALDTNGLLSFGPQSKVQIVDANGAEVWWGAAKMSANGSRVLLPGGLAAGRYWVRILNGQDILREYGLAVD